MAKTIKESFQKLKENLNISDLQESTVSTRQKNVRKAVEKNLDVLDSFLTGSYSRNTMIAPLGEADIDIFIVLDPKYYHRYNGQNGGQAGLLDLVKRTLKKTYTKTPDISRNGQAVTIQFEDFMVDVVPGFKRKGGGYLIANSIIQSWISTDPKEHIKISSQANDAHDDDYVPLVKMIKGWNKEYNSHFNSFHLEVLALDVLDEVKISDFPSGVRYYFDKCRDLITKENPDPAGYGGDVGYYLNTKEKVDEAVDIFEQAYEIAVKAQDEESRDNIESAIESWIKIFGDYFPAYG